MVWGKLEFSPYDLELKVSPYGYVKPHKQSLW